MKTIWKRKLLTSFTQSKNENFCTLWNCSKYYKNHPYKKETILWLSCICPRNTVECFFFISVLHRPVFISVYVWQVLCLSLCVSVLCVSLCLASVTLNCMVCGSLCVSLLCVNVVSHLCVCDSWVCICLPLGMTCLFLGLSASCFCFCIGTVFCRWVWPYMCATYALIWNARLESLGGTYITCEDGNPAWEAFRIYICELWMSLCQFCYFVSLLMFKCFKCVCIAGASCVCVSAARQHVPLRILRCLFSSSGLVVLLDIVSLVGRGTGRAGVNHFLLYLNLRGLRGRGWRCGTA